MRASNRIGCNPPSPPARIATRRGAAHKPAAAAHAETVASAAELIPGAHFTRHRRAIRDALIADGVAAIIDTLVARLLDGTPA